MNVQVGSPIPTPPTNPVIGLYGYLTVDSGKVTGVLSAKIGLHSTCTAGFTGLAVTGTVDATGNYNLAFPVGSGQATVQLAPMTTRSGYLGTYQVTGGDCAQPLIALDGYPVATLLGTYTGSFTGRTVSGPNTDTATVTATFTQGTTPNPDGTFPLTGSATVSGPCGASIVFSSGLITGEGFTSQPLQLTIPGPPIVSINGAIAPTSSSVAGTVLSTYINTPLCPTETFGGVLTRQ